MDTGLVLQLRAFLGPLEADLGRLAAGLARLAEEHRDTAMVGRTWLQQALPTTFGLKAAGWLDAVGRHRQRLAELRPRLLVVQLGGAAGTLASLGGRGLEVAEALAGELGLAAPALPWHGARDRVAELAALARAARRHARQDGARLVAHDADRGRRGAGAGGRGPGRLLDHAAQAQPGRRRRGAGRRGPGARAGRHHAVGDGAGARARPGRLARRVGDAARAGRAGRGRAAPGGGGRGGPGGRPRADAGEPRADARARSWPRRCRWRWARSSAGSRRTGWSSGPPSARWRRGGSWAPSWPRTATVTGALAPGELERLLDPSTYLGVAAAFVDRALAAARDSRGEA